MRYSCDSCTGSGIRRRGNTKWAFDAAMPASSSVRSIDVAAFTLIKAIYEVYLRLEHALEVINAQMGFSLASMVS